MIRIEQIEQKLARRPYSPLFARLANEYLNAGRIEQAKELCLSGLEKYPSYATAHIVIAKCYASEKNYSAAIGHLRRSATALPDALLISQLETEWEQLNRLIGKDFSVSDLQVHTTSSIDKEAFFAKNSSTTTITVEEISAPLIAVTVPLATAPPHEKFIIEDGRIISKTLAEIYAMQGEYGEAIITYRMLRQQRPQMRGECDLRIGELEQAMQAKLNHQKSIVNK